MARLKDVKIDDMEVTAIGEIPNIVTVSGDYKTEISDEVVYTEEQPEIVEEVEVVEDVIEEVVKRDDLDYKARGFKSLDAAYDFVNTERFANLGDADKAEFMNWLQK